MSDFSIISSQDQIRTGMVLFDILGFKAIFYAPPSATSTVGRDPPTLPPPDYFNLHLMLFEIHNNTSFCKICLMLSEKITLILR